MSLEDIKARAEKQPCTNYENHACSRGDRMKLVAALEAVRAVHEPFDALLYSGRHQRKVQVCTGCGTDDGNWQNYPCPTIRAIGKAVEA